MTYLINSNIKEIKIIATNGIDSNTAIVIDDNNNNKEYCRRWYQSHKEQKKIYAKANKDHIAEYHKKYYQDHKKNKKKNKKNDSIQMSRLRL